MPLDTDSPCYDRLAPASRRVRALSLQGRPVALRPGEHGSLALALFSGGALHCTPLACVAALRPSLAHLDAADEKLRAEAERQQSARRPGPSAQEEDVEDDDSGGGARLTPLQVQVARRETERQAEQRLASHAYLRQQEEEEPWARLAPHGPASGEAAALLARLGSGRVTAPAGHPLAPPAYLDALLPPRPQPSSLAAAGGGADLGLSAAYLDSLPLGPRLEAALSRGARQLLDFRTLLSLAPPGTGREELLAAVGAHAVCVQGVWAARSELIAPGDAAAAALRDAVLLLFSETHVVGGTRLAGLGVAQAALQAALEGIAVPLPGSSGDHQLLLPRDEAFIAEHSNVVAAQQASWDALRSRMQTQRVFGFGAL